MNMKEALAKEANYTRTENGAVALKSTGEALVDLFGVIGSLRQADELRKTTLFSEAYKCDPLIATKMLFYARDIRGGLGERDTFRDILKFMANHHPEIVELNIDLIPEYGRFDDWYVLVDTPVESLMWEKMGAVLKSDLANMEQGKPCTLLAKWIKTADSSQKATRELGIKTALKLGYKVPEFKRLVRKLRRYIGVLEVSLCEKAYENIVYETVPSKAMLRYRNAFTRNDEARFKSYLESLSKGEAKINASTLYPYDLVKVYRHNSKEDPVVEAQWKELPDYLEDVENSNVLVMCDVSGSMTWSSAYPLDTSVSLSIYFAERNKGMFADTFMIFSENPQFLTLRGETLAQKYHNVLMDGNKCIGYSTNLGKAFENVLSVAIKHNVPQSDMPAAIVIISDMEIDRCDESKYNESFYETMKRRYAEHGYEIPNIVFWNVESRQDTFHADARRPGVQLVSGSSPVSFKNMLTCIGYDAYDAMIKTLSNERYDAIRIS